MKNKFIYSLANVDHHYHKVFVVDPQHLKVELIIPLILSNEWDQIEWAQVMFVRCPQMWVGVHKANLSLL